jgi:hypothetical protein
MMRLACFLTALLLSAPILAADDADEHAGHHPPAAAEDGSGQPDHKVGSATHLQKNMQTMQDLMAKIRETTDAAEKKRLLGVHMLAMQEQIKTIRSVYAKAGGHEHGDEGKADAGKADAGKADAGKDGKGKQGGMMGEGGMMGGGMMMKKMHKQMEQRMDAVEQLLQQFIEHEAVEEDAKGE